MVGDCWRAALKYSSVKVGWVNGYLGGLVEKEGTVMQALFSFLKRFVANGKRFGGIQWMYSCNKQHLCVVVSF